MRAYRHQSAFCALQHVELLDAARITPDSALHGSQLLAMGCRCVGCVVCGLGGCCWVHPEGWVLCDNQRPSTSNQ